MEFKKNMKMRVLKIGILKNYLKIRVLKIKFEELFENGILEN